MEKITRSELHIQYQNKIREKVRKVFIDHNLNIDFYTLLQNQNDGYSHKRIYYKIKKSMTLRNFNIFINKLIDLDMLECYEYRCAFNLNLSINFYGYSVLLELIMELNDYIISFEISKKYKTYLGYYINWEKFDIGIKKFQSFYYLAKRVDWPKLIEKSKKSRTFGNGTTKSIIKESIDSVLRTNCATPYHHPGGINELLDIIAFGMFEDVSVIEKIAYNNKHYSLSNEVLQFIKDYILFENVSVKERLKRLHKQYAIKRIHKKNIHRFEEFYQLLKDKVGNDVKLLIALR